MNVFFLCILASICTLNKKINTFSHLIFEPGERERDNPMKNPTIHCSQNTKIVRGVPSLKSHVFE